jgi:hypothetical protein
MLLVPSLLFPLLLGFQQLFCQRVILANLRERLMVVVMMMMVGVVAFVLVDVRVEVKLL